MTLSSGLILCGGLLCFLYGMYRMTCGFQQAASQTIERKFRTLLSSPWRGLLLGTACTAVIQSSSAVTVMLLGMVHARILSFAASFSVIMGADIGTTATAWLVALTALEQTGGGEISFSPEILPLGALLFGLLLQLPVFPRGKNAGDILLGFGILWCGMQSMSSSAQGLVLMPQTADWMTAFRHPLGGILAGAAFTGVIQSSSAAIGMLQALSLTGTVTFQMAIPLMMGINVGTCVTAVLASVGVRREARQVAAAHVLIKILGVGLNFFLFQLAERFLGVDFFLQTADVFQIAWMHTLFNVWTVGLLFPFQSRLIRLVRWLIPEQRKTRV